MKISFALAMAIGIFVCCIFACQNNKENYSNRILRPINQAKNSTVRNIKASFTNPTFSYALNRVNQLFI